ncbi:uncharacterized protein LOC114248635 [Bombyx mandarina]|uniref:Uncharacterized protein LOC114248635 n=1 Tax=Bombyx mandarina TaxID=7092 RepID=A0A6J2K613_BOMMA|nr:uncharacterized protein LOC114248635 [Bombyx mandarina]
MLPFLVVNLIILHNIQFAKSSVLPVTYATGETVFDDLSRSEEIGHEKLLGFKDSEDQNEEKKGFDLQSKRMNEGTKKPCAVVVLSNIQNPNVQSLLRKYRYDANGVLIPSSVKYFIKLPQGLRNSPLLVPLNDKAFSPLGGFVRYYKEVPPIPQSW